MFSVAKQRGPIKIIGNYNGVSFYRNGDQYLVRMANGLTAKRVKNDPAFAATRVYARLLAQSSRIASKIYQALPKEFRQFWMFRAFTGEALRFLKEGNTSEQVFEILWNTYVAVHDKEKIPQVNESQKKTRSQ